jgi:arylsulfatase A-like enzyme
MTQLDKLGVAGSTLIIFVGDNGSDAPLGDTHGYASSAPLRGKKGTHYEGGMRVPFIVAWARPSPSTEIQKRFAIESGVVHDEFASICDVFPTLAALAGVESPAGHRVDGHSLWNTFGGKRGVHPQKFLMHYPHRHRSSYFTVYREGRWKLIYHYTRAAGERYELFDLVADPYEKANLAGSRPQVLESMLAATRRQLTDAGGQYPVDKDTQAPLGIE